MNQLTDGKKGLLDITPEEFLGLYKKHNLKPQSQRVYVENGGCCALGTIVVERGIADDDKHRMMNDLEEELALTKWDLNEFGFGFDDGLTAARFIPGNPSTFYAHGHRVGAFLREAKARGEV